MVLLPGITVGTDCVTNCMTNLCNQDSISSKQIGHLNKVVYQIRDCHSYQDGTDRVAHRIFVKVLTHEVIEIKELDKNRKVKSEEKKAREEKMNKVHMFRMVTIPRDYT